MQFIKNCLVPSSTWFEPELMYNYPNTTNNNNYSTTINNKKSKNNLMICLKDINSTIAAMWHASFLIYDPIFTS